MNGIGQAGEADAHADEDAHEVVNRGHSSLHQDAPSSPERKAGSGSGLTASHSELGFSHGCRRRSGWAGTARFRGSSWLRRRGPPARSAPSRRAERLHRRLGDDARQFGELGVGDWPPLATGEGGADAKTECRGAAMIMVFMVSLHLPARFPGGPLFASGRLPLCDDGKMGFHPIRDNRPLWHRIYARGGAKAVTLATD